MSAPIPSASVTTEPLLSMSACGTGRACVVLAKPMQADGGIGGARPYPSPRGEGQQSLDSGNESPLGSPVDSPSRSSASAKAPATNVMPRRGPPAPGMRKRGFVVQGQDSRAAGQAIQSLQQTVIRLHRQVEASGGNLWEPNTSGARDGDWEYEGGVGGWCDVDTNVLAILPRALEAARHENLELREHNQLLWEMRSQMGLAPSNLRSGPSASGSSMGSQMGSRVGSKSDLTERGIEDRSGSGSLMAMLQSDGRPHQSSRPSLDSSRPSSRRSSRTSSPPRPKPLPPSIPMVAERSPSPPKPRTCNRQDHNLPG